MIAARRTSRDADDHREDPDATPRPSADSHLRSSPPL
jgi:hypothetical protein